MDRWPLTSSEAKVTLHDLKPVAGLLLDPAVFAVRADSPYKTLREFIEAAKAQPGQLKQSGGSVTSRDNIIRQSLQAAPVPDGHSSRFQEVESASLLCSEGTWT